jgi:imidazolonepropionase-like amidohydrolase
MKRSLITCLVAAILVCAHLAAQAPGSASASGPVAIRAGLLIDPQLGTAERNQIIVVENGKIAAVGADGRVPAGAATIDLSRYTVLPGLMDAHTHLCMDMNPRRDAGSYFHTTLRDPDSYRSIQGVVNARTMLEAGFTTIRDVGNEGNYACSSVRSAIEAGLIPGPTMLNAGRIIAPYGGQFHLQPDRPELAEPEYFFADSRDELRKAVRENIHYGARVIKLVVDDQPYIYSVDDIRFAVGEAALAGFKVAAHVWTRAGAHNAAAAGVATMEHLNGVADEDLDLAAQNGVIAVFTPFPLAALQQSRSPERAKQEFAQEIDRLKSAYRKAVPVAFGTDVITELPGLTRGGTAMQWIDSYTAAGFLPKDLLTAMTATAARAIGVEKQRGAIRQGMAADIVAVTGNPLEDVSALKHVAFVMKDGRIIVNPK